MLAWRYQLNLIRPLEGQFEVLSEWCRAVEPLASNPPFVAVCLIGQSIGTNLPSHILVSSCWCICAQSETLLWIMPNVRCLTNSVAKPCYTLRLVCIGSVRVACMCWRKLAWKLFHSEELFAIPFFYQAIQRCLEIWILRRSAWRRWLRLRAVASTMATPAP